ncbi:type II toxin-antitoxin system Phd/YefM family antitoxin [Nocardiopsis sp. CC223A]|uniref:type II toxin-antitoxin system Phd/YefM family antitoxin n=1 Tax=Nocardiopsis sp. CC223A TaxID=3044051 RepID=UPI00278C2B36|nr:type II toxin-antitoxin system prevent-host-death family antitoxin [Nocardiopsis sp. CC223A]
MEMLLMEHQITIRELQRNTAEVIDRARRGEHFLITRHGEIVGRLVPPDPAEEALTRAVNNGLIDLRDLESLPTAGEAAGMPREPSPAGTRPASDALLELREEEER